MGINFEVEFQCKAVQESLTRDSLAGALTVPISQIVQVAHVRFRTEE